MLWHISWWLELNWKQVAVPAVLECSNCSLHVMVGSALSETVATVSLSTVPRLSHRRAFTHGSNDAAEVRGSFQETAPRKTAETTVKHCDGGGGSVVDNHHGGNESLVVVTTLQPFFRLVDCCLLLLLFLIVPSCSAVLSSNCE